jgi:hypothetical protein
MVRIVTLFLASPGDFATERRHVADVAAGLNRNMAHERDVQFKVLDWKTHARPRVHQQGPQGPIDEDMPVVECDIVVGILWKRFGTPIPEMGGETGSEHEIRSAIAAWRESGKPEVVMCFNDAPYRHKDVAELKQATQVMEFREEIRGLELAYDGPDDFREKIRDYLEKYLKKHHPVTPGKVSPVIAGDPARYIKPCARKLPTSTCRVSDSATTAPTVSRSTNSTSRSPLRPAPARGLSRSRKPWRRIANSW